ncbi:TIM barrel protein [Schaedlerella arabinosiphila]|uniref:TIM barrel protein n=1 Tax=Schaedlerella arabinosiphila TaxID=2044587 RepID=A0A9X5CCL6_9FIRM|nr:TIM barrel protein [Schaedlerella arabinosiphila]NDO72214.1 TIM barrel protein [Schaedlerella arabinosiphila]
MGKVNLQMYSFMDGTMNDSRENFRRAAEMGYDGAELFGPDFEIPAEELKALLEELNLEPVSLHAPKTEMVEELIPFANTLGMKFIGIGMEVLKDEESVHRFAKTLNRIGKACAEKGLMLTYNNHTQEFADCGRIGSVPGGTETALDGACGTNRVIDVLMRETDPKYVSFEMDACWCAAAGFDPIAFVEQYSGRVKLIHIKESSRVVGPQPPMDFSTLPRDENGAPIFSDELKKTMEELDRINCRAGEGLVDWKALKEAADQNGCQAYIVEREYSVSGNRLNDLKADLEYYRTQI